MVFLSEEILVLFSIKLIYTWLRILTGMATNDTPQLHGQGSLSERELQIVELVASGLTNQEISEKTRNQQAHGGQPYQQHF